jgi:hypothetical protein
MRTFIASAQLLGIAAAVSVGATACSSSSAVPPTLGGTSLPSALGASTANMQGAQRLAKPAKKQAKALLYVAGFSADAVFVYDQAGKSTQPLYKITNGISDPNGLATDSSGNLYVANELSNALTIYAPGSKSPIASITNGVSTPFAVAVDSNGNIFVANDPSGSGQSPYIDEYAGGQSSPSYTWYPPQSNGTITGLALINLSGSTETIEATYYTFDASGNPHGDLMQCYAGNPSCSGDGYSFGRTGGVAVASTQPFDMLVADQTAPGIWNLNVSSTKLIKTSYDPWFMAFTPAHTRLFVSNGGSDVMEYTYPGMKLKKTFVASGGYEGPFVTGVAVTPSGTF